MSLSPSFLEISFALGGKMLEIRTKFVPAIPASLNAYSKLVSLSSCMPFPFVRNNFLATRSNNSFIVQIFYYL